MLLISKALQEVSKRYSIKGISVLILGFQIEEQNYKIMNRLSREIFTYYLLMLINSIK